VVQGLTAIGHSDAGGRAQRLEDQFMRVLTILGCFTFLCAAGCGSMKASSTNPASTPVPVAVPMDAPPQSPPAESQNQPVASNAPSPSADTTRPVVPPPSPATTPPPVKSKPVTDTRPTKQPSATGPTAPAAVAPAAQTAPAPKSGNVPASATLDLGQLESRLRDTRAIGVFTKLSLKNQVDDLLGEFRVYYRGSNQRPSAELRQHYDSLLVKVLGLLRDGDPTLASAISSSREAIWGILADPDQFAKL
jgi:hypothetical protein